MTREQKIEAVKLTAELLPKEQQSKFLEEAYKTFIREDVRKEFEQPDVEAMLRSMLAELSNAVAYLYEVVSTIHEGELENKLSTDKVEEFKKFNDCVENIKNNIKEAML